MALRSSAEHLQTMASASPERSTNRGDDPGLSKRPASGDPTPMSEAHEEPILPEQRSTAALRMRRSRARRRRGEAIVNLEIGPGVIIDVVALGWLGESDHSDKDAIARALMDLVERAILARLTPSACSQGRTSFVCDLPPSTVDTLIGLRWLPPEHAGDADAIATASRRFAGRALSVASRGALDLRNVQRR
jgi:hypothetical protein